MLHLQLQDLPDIHPRFQNHELIATRSIPTGALLCGTELARFQRGSAALFHHSPNVGRALTIDPLSNPHQRGYYSWNNLDLLALRVEDCIFPSVLLATRSHRFTIPGRPVLYPNIVLHFLGDGLTCGEALCPIAAGDVICCHWRFGAFHSKQAELTRGWINMHPHDQADILMNTVDDCSGYFFNCAFHDEDEYRPDQAIWYKEETFVCVGKLIGAQIEEEKRLCAEEDAEWDEYLKMCTEDVNVAMDPLDVLLSSLH